MYSLCHSGPKGRRISKPVENPARGGDASLSMTGGWACQPVGAGVDSQPPTADRGPTPVRTGINKELIRKDFMNPHIPLAG